MKLKHTLAGLVMLMTMAFFLPTESRAQVYVNIHKHHHWAPSCGYQPHTRYIFYPDYNMYYDLRREAFIYLNGGGNWVIGIDLPVRFGRIDFARTAFIELDLVTDRPYYYNNRHIERYCNHNHAHYVRLYGRHDRHDHDRYDRHDHDRYDRHDHDRYDKHDKYYDKKDHGKHNDKYYKGKHGKDNNWKEKGGNNYGKHNNNKGNKGDWNKSGNGNGNKKRDNVYYGHRKG